MVQVHGIIYYMYRSMVPIPVCSNENPLNSWIPQFCLAHAVIVAVRKASSGFSGYSGPTFVPASDYGLADDEFAIVAISRKTVSVYENKPTVLAASSRSCSHMP